MIQKWAPFERSHVLLDQFRARCKFDELWTALKCFAKRTPSAIVIENTAYGRALIERARGYERYKVVSVNADGRSKNERLAPHLQLIRKGGIVVPAAAEWAEDYIQEMVAFPNGLSDDQVDATTQYLDFMAQKPALERRPEPGTAAIAYGSRTPYMAGRYTAGGMGRYITACYVPSRSVAARVRRYP